MRFLRLFFLCYIIFLLVLVPDTVKAGIFDVSRLTENGEFSATFGAEFKTGKNKEADANDDFEFCFNDMSSDEIKTSSISVVKQKLSQKINAATYTLVLVGKEANQEHKDAREIGYRNWINYEIQF